MTQRTVLACCFLATLGLINDTCLSADKLYWTEAIADKVRRADLNGTNVQDLVTTGPGTPGASTPWGVALDTTNGKMYWSDTVLDKIQRANLDGTGVENLLVTGTGSASGVLGIDLDVIGGKMYWTDFALNKVRRANLNGTSIEDLVVAGPAAPGTSVNTNSGPMGIALDLASQKMYWANPRVDAIQRANFDGTNVENIITGVPFGFGVTLDSYSQKIYWTDAQNDRIERANFDGTGRENVFTTGPGGGITVPPQPASDPIALALDAARQHIYWIDDARNQINRVGFDGSNFATIISGGDAVGLAIDVGPPEPHLSTTPAHLGTLPFGNVRVGTTSIERAVSISNTGGFGSTLTGSFSAPDGYGPFSAIDPPSIGPISSADPPVLKEFVFQPTNRGVALPKSIEVTTNGGSSTIMLTGRGVGPRFGSDDLPIVAKQAVVDFGDVALNGPGLFEFTIRNSTPDGDLGDVTDLTITSLSFSGTGNPADFSVLDGLTVGQTLSADEPTTVRVQATPSQVGQRMATLVIGVDEGGPAGITNNTYRIHLLATPEKRVTIQPIRVLETDGSRGAPLDVFEDFTQTIWDQAGIDIQFLPAREFGAGSFLNIGDQDIAGDTSSGQQMPDGIIDELDFHEELTRLFNDAGHMQHDDPQVLNMFFVDNLINGQLDYLGINFIGGRNIAIDGDAVLDLEYGTIAHEIGHALGLDHPFEEGQNYGINNLMNACTTDEPCTLHQLQSIGQIAPSGDLAQLTPEQLSRTRSSSYALRAFQIAVPEPSTLLLAAALLCLQPKIRRSRRRPVQI